MLVRVLYLALPLTRATPRYDGDTLMDADNDAVMMEWERPLMEAHAGILAPEAGVDVLNVGFGMGIVDGALQKREPRSHTIMEAHPQVLQRMDADGWASKPGVVVLRGRWQDTIAQLPDNSLDAVFFDTYGEYDADMHEFHKLLPRILRAGGRYSFFNGFCPHNLFFQNVACQVVVLELQGLGLSCDFAEVQLQAQEGKTWDGVKRPYFFSNSYYLPVATKAA